MKKLKSILAFVLIFSLIFSFTSCGEETVKFTYDEMTITLDSSFEEVDFEGYNVCYDSKNAAVLVLKESFTALGGASEYTTQEYRDLIISTNSVSNPIPLEIDSMYCMEHIFSIPIPLKNTAIFQLPINLTKHFGLFSFLA